jgi:hypothetical protein
MLKAHKDLLKSIPDFFSWADAASWINLCRQRLDNLTSKDISEPECLSLEWKNIEDEKDPHFGLYPSEKWRKFVLAAFAADLLSFDKPVDQVNFERLLFVMHAFPEGFRVWWIKCADIWLPVGYTGWYPMLETMYVLMETKPDQLKDRMVVPHPSSISHHPYLYLFNFSVAAICKKTKLSNALMKRYIQEITEQHAKGFSCITVSEDGIRVANRLGMACSGHLDLDGSLEGIYLKRFPVHPRTEL